MTVQYTPAFFFGQIEKVDNVLEGFCNLNLLAYTEQPDESISGGVRQPPLFVLQVISVLREQYEHGLVYHNEFSPTLLEFFPLFLYLQQILYFL